MRRRTVSIWSAVGGVGSSRSSRGRRTWMRSRAGLSLTPAKSSTWASTVTLLRIVSRFRPAAWSAATSSRDVGGRDLVDAAGAEQRQDAGELDAMADRGSVGDVDPRGAPPLRSLGEGRCRWRGLSRRPMLGTRIAASSPATQRPTGQCVPSCLERARVTPRLSRPPSRYLTRYRVPPAISRRSIQALAIERNDA